MRLTDFLDKGASLGVQAPCLTTAGRTLSYFDVQRLSWQVARALDRSGIAPGDKVAILSANDPVAFSCVFGISRAGAVWCPVNPRNEAAENRDLLDLFNCRCLIFQAAFAPLVARILPGLPKLTVLVCLDGEPPDAIGFDLWTGPEPAEPWQAEPPDDMVMLVGTGGTTGRPKGVMLTGRNIETMSALTLMSYPFRPRPRYLALAPLTHAAGVLCFPVMTLGGEIVIMPKPDLTEFLALIAKHEITHTFLPPTLIYMLLDHARLAETGPASLESRGPCGVVRAHDEPRGDCAYRETDEESDNHGAPDHRSRVGRHKKCWPRRTRKSIGTSTRRLTRRSSRSQAGERRESRSLRTFVSGRYLSRDSIAFSSCVRSGKPVEYHCGASFPFARRTVGVPAK